MGPIACGRVLVVGFTGSSAPLRSLIEQLGGTCAAARNLQEAIQDLRDHPETDLVLLVPGLSEASQAELCRAIKFDRRTALMPVVALRPAGSERLLVPLYEAGADDCLSLDAPPRELEARLTKAIRLKHASDSLEDATAVILSLAKAIEGKDGYTCGHVERVGSYSVEIGRRAGLDDAGLTALRVGGVVHDIGKVMIPDPILNKRCGLTEEERKIMRRHPVIGYDILKPLRTFRQVLPIVRWHHERPNGRGYPDRLAGPEIPLIVRIISVADVFDALSTDRPYRKAYTPERCRELLLDEAKQGNLDADMVQVLLKAMTDGTVAAGSTASAAAV